MTEYAYFFDDDASSRLTGTEYEDWISGSRGNDWIRSLEGRDVLWGGWGIDRFVFDAPIARSNVDTIMDFEAHDVLRLDQDIFGSLKKGALKKSQFEIGTKADDGNDYLIYNPKNGKLYYDADGSGTDHGRQHVATVHGAAVLNHTDIIVF